ncbi:MAG: CxxxxCH/CxxCH domain c-type cytochrome [Desulfobulbaceae bacterium]
MSREEAGKGVILSTKTMIGALLLFSLLSPSIPEAHAALDPPHDTAGCLSCHDMTSTEPDLLPPLGHPPTTIDETPANAACEKCHLTGELGIPAVFTTHSSDNTDEGYGKWTVECSVCHNQHLQEQEINGSSYGKFIRQSIDLTGIKLYDTDGNPLPGKSGAKAVVFKGPTGLNSFADGEGAIDGICEVCHTLTSHWRNDGTLAGVGVHDGLRGSNCMGCHPHHKGFKASCDICHGFPPVVNIPQAGDGLVVSPAATGGTTAGWHAVHATTKRPYVFPCATCHYNGMPDTPINGNDRLQIGFSGRALLADDAAGTEYRGRSLIPPYAYEGTNGTTVSIDGTMTCANIYCHSIGQRADGQPLVQDTADYAGPKWNETVAVPYCSFCHQGSPPSGSHPRHLESMHCNKCHYSALGGSQCDYCHAPHPQPGERLSRVTTALHVNREINVGIIAPYGGTYNGTPAPGDGFASCSNTYCHSNGTSVATGAVPDNTSADWGSGPLTCSSCHEYGPTYNLYAPKANSHVRHDFLGCEHCHYQTTTDGTTIAGTALHVNRQYDLAPSPTYHRNGSDYPNTFTYAFDSGGGTCSNISCHAGLIDTTKRWGNASLTPTGFNFNYTDQGCYGITITSGTPSCYPASACAPPYTYNWVFSDGYTFTSSGTSSSVSHEFGVAGSYTATVTVTAANGLNGTRTSTSFTPDPPANVQPTLGIATAVNARTLTLTDLTVDPDYNFCGHSGSAQVRIVWGDGETTLAAIALTDQPSNQTFVHTYSTSGTKTLQYYIWDNADTWWKQLSPNPQVLIP